MADELREDIAAARARMRTKFGGGREIKRLVSHLHERERVERMTTGTYGSGMGLVVLTDQRLLFVKDGMMSQTTEDFPMSKVTSVQWSSGLTQGTITVFASGNKAEIKNVLKDDGKELVDLIRSRISDAAAVAATTPAASSGLADIERLAGLHAQGILTDEEFAAAKARALGL